MRKLGLLATIVCVGFPRLALAQPTVTVGLQSPQADQFVRPASIIEWSIVVSVSTGDNEGLALICCDLVQDHFNPRRFDLSPGDADSIDATMQNFSRPLGISNPGEDGAYSGYIGVLRGPSNRKNVVQIGGAQNTFGQVGQEMGLSDVVIPGVGQGVEPQLVLSGAFTVPATEGTYYFRLENAIANVLQAHYDPPLFSPVISANVVLDPSGFSFTVRDCIGDVDGDGDTGHGDLGILLADWGCVGDNCVADLNGDGRTDHADLGILLSDWGCASQPSPSPLPTH